MGREHPRHRKSLNSLRKGFRGLEQWGSQCGKHPEHKAKGGKFANWGEKKKRSPSRWEVSKKVMGGPGGGPLENKGEKTQ